MTLSERLKAKGAIDHPLFAVPRLRFKMER